jgi:hypothetical protein
MKRKIIDAEGRDCLIIWLRRWMRESGVTFDAPRADVPYYFMLRMDASGVAPIRA